MCGLLRAQDRSHYEKVSRSMRIGGHSTSVRLEAAFWRALDEIAQQQGVPVSRLVAALHDEALVSFGGRANLASILRTVCLIHKSEREDVRSGGERAR
jgi:predicted DNA-binding ribbon-helix-helix protein